MPRAENAGGQVAPVRGALARDQRWAVYAYRVAGAVLPDQREAYRGAVRGLGAIILRSGLSAAMAALQRLDAGGKTLLEHLAEAGVPGLEGATGDDLAKRVREMDVEAYMAATREMLQVAAWLKRAADGTFGEE